MRDISRLGELCEDVVQDSGSALKHIVVPIARDLKTFGCQFRISSCVAFRRRVLATVNFYNETLFKADEVENVALKGDLPAEFDVIQLTIA